jgi:hypothetical protein
MRELHCISQARVQIAARGTPLVTWTSQSKGTFMTLLPGLGVRSVSELNGQSTIFPPRKEESG